MGMLSVTHQISFQTHGAKFWGEFEDNSFFLSSTTMATDTGSLTKGLLSQSVTTFTVNTQHAPLSVRLGMKRSPSGPVCKMKDLESTWAEGTDTPNRRPQFTNCCSIRSQERWHPSLSVMEEELREVYSQKSLVSGDDWGTWQLSPLWISSLFPVA